MRATLGALSKGGARVISVWYHDATGEEEGPADWPAPEGIGKNLGDAFAAVAADDIERQAHNMNREVCAASLGH